MQRLFASGRFTLDRLTQVANLLGCTLAQLTQQAQTEELRLRTLTEARLLLVAVCVLNHWRLPDMVAA